jgi:rhamnosyl/mannosyltransferase
MESHLQDLGRELSRHGVVVSALVANDGRSDHIESDGAVRVLRCGTKANLASVQLCPTMLRRLRAESFDLLHVHWPHPFGAAIALAAVRGKPMVVTYHSDIVRQHFLAAMIQPLIQRFLGRCDAIIATSEGYLRSSPWLQRHAGRCRVVPHGIRWSPPRSADYERAERLRQEVGGPFILAVGRLIYYKGFHSLIQALSHTKARLVLVGSGPLRTALEREARLCGVADRVHFAGEVNDLLPYYLACDVFVLPSVARSEAFGIVQLEAMAAGKPVINTSIDSGVPDVSRNGETGLTVSPNDPEALAAAINQLLIDTDLRSRMGERGRQRFALEFTAHVMGARTLDIYRDVMGRS